MVTSDLLQACVKNKTQTEIRRLLQQNKPIKAQNGSTSHLPLQQLHGSDESKHCQRKTDLVNVNFPQASGIVTSDFPEDYPSVSADLFFNWPSPHLPHFSCSWSQKLLQRRRRWLPGEYILRAHREGHS